MRPDEFVAFEAEKPAPHKWLIVTNNLDARNAYGEMSHVWLTTFWTQGAEDWMGIVTFADTQRIVRLTHWKYA